jgi:hypothetical protein
VIFSNSLITSGFDSIGIVISSTIHRAILYHMGEKDARKRGSGGKKKVRR